jgi:hypothetical protein
VEFEQGLNVAMSKLREALGDSAALPTYIETIPKRGYRFIGEVKYVRAETPPERESAPAPLRVVPLLRPASQGGAAAAPEAAREPEMVAGPFVLPEPEGRRASPFRLSGGVSRGVGTRYATGVRHGGKVP